MREFFEGVVEAYGEGEWAGTLSVRLLGVKKEEGLLEHVRVLTSFTNKNVGSLILPELQDYVVLSFLDEGRTQAICHGSLLQPNCEMVKKLDKENHVKIIRMKSAFGVMINETADKEMLTLNDKAGLQLMMDEEKQTLSIGQRDGKQVLIVNMKEKSVTLQGQETLSLICGKAKLIMEKGNVTLEGTDIKINGTTLAVDTKKEVTISSVSCSMKASNKAVVHGATCEVSADAKQDIKGAIIQIG